ncbi:MAG TPA: hypothetical protein VGO62_11645 [Myxococcota bacterium]|jgi:hypothetical protein
MPTAEPKKNAATNARVHCDKCGRESDVEVTQQTTNTGKVFWQGQCKHCGAAVFAVATLSR